MKKTHSTRRKTEGVHAEAFSSGGLGKTKKLREKRIAKQKREADLLRKHEAEPEKSGA